MRVVLADDHVLLRAGVAELLTSGGFDVVGQAGDPDTLLELVDTTAPDVAVVDIRMPPTFTLEGLRAAHEIRARHGRAVGVVLLSQHIEARYAVELIADGAAGLGYLLKDRILDPADLCAAVRRVGEGGSAIDPAVIEQLMQRRQNRGPLAALTEREREVLAGMAEGRSNQSVAVSLHISEKTVEGCTGRIFSKLGLEADADQHRRVLAVLAYLQAT